MSESTKDTILRVAERRYATDGFAATSLRAIIKEAAVNTAAIHYHFGSREALIEAVITRRTDAVNCQRIELLDRLAASHPTGPLPLEGVIEAFLHPVIRMQIDNAEEAAVFRKLIGRIAMETDDELRGIVMRIFDDIRKRFVSALVKALPNATPEDVLWKFHFMIGAMCFATAIPPGHGGRSSANAVSLDSKEHEVLERLVRFTAGGMRAGSAVAP